MRRLQALVQDSPDLNGAAQLYAAILPLLRDADLRVASPSITRDRAREKLEMGLPLLPGLDLELDGQAVQRLMLRLAQGIEALGETNPLHESQGNGAALPAAAGRIRLAVEEGKLDLGALLPQIAAGSGDWAASMAHDLDLDPDLLRMLAQNALRPALHAWRRELTPLVEGIRWDSGYCFVCGAAATLGELRGKDKSKHLRCGECGADWPFPRLQCMACGNEDHRSLGYLYPEGRGETMRVEVCAACDGYLKVITTFAPTLPEMLAVEDLATLYLDYVAQGRGYARMRGETEQRTGGALAGQ